MKTLQSDNRVHELSLGFRTEMIFHRFNGVVHDRGEYLVVKTPSNPGFFFGNLLLFFEAPKLGSLDRWKQLFQMEFNDLPEVKHFTFLWDSPSEGIGDVTELGMEGFSIDFSVVLRAQSVHPPAKYSSQIQVRPITSDTDWREVIECQILSKSDGFDEPSYRIFKERQMARYRAMSEQGFGHWFSAFLDGKLVGDLGIFKDGSLGRFQSVETHPDFRRQGICGALVYEAAKFAFESMAITELVMVADENYHAAKIYESVGFIPTLKEYSAFWWDKNRG
jgi:ribosomal protein S18 acetylase RimI-like enzyme